MNRFRVRPGQQLGDVIVNEIEDIDLFILGVLKENCYIMLNIKKKPHEGV